MDKNSAGGSDLDAQGSRASRAPQDPVNLMPSIASPAAPGAAGDQEASGSVGENIRQGHGAYPSKRQRRQAAPRTKIRTGVVKTPQAKHPAAGSAAAAREPGKHYKTVREAAAAAAERRASGTAPLLAPERGAAVRTAGREGAVVDLTDFTDSEEPSEVPLPKKAKRQRQRRTAVQHDLTGPRSRGYMASTGSNRGVGTVPGVAAPAVELPFGKSAAPCGEATVVGFELPMPQVPSSAIEGPVGNSAAGCGVKRGMPRKQVELSELRSFCTTMPGIHIGTSGYSYRAWHADQLRFYPPGVSSAREWEYYSSEFNCLEINASHYRFFEPHTWDSWRERAAAVRPSFTYIAKVQRLFTHMKRLNIDDAFKQSWSQFWSRVERLKPHLGATLFQFPSNFATMRTTRDRSSNIDRLSQLGEVLPCGERFVFEFRHPSWFCAEVYEIMRANDWCLALVDMHRDLRDWEEAENEEAKPKRRRLPWPGEMGDGSHPAADRYPLDLCSWGAFARFHGTTGQYTGSYGQERMAQWAAQAIEWAGSGRQVFMAFNNTDDGRPPSAVQDCRHLAMGLRQLGAFQPLPGALH